MTGEIVRADLKALGLEGHSFGQLFYNGKRQILARYPNFDHDNPYAGGFLYAEGEKETASKSRLVAPPEGIRDWADPAEGQVWVFPGTNYWNNIVPIESVDPETRVIALAKETSYAINPGDRYFVRGFLEELDAPGEWYLDGETSTLYFWPPGPLEGARVSVPRVGTIVSIAKDPGETEWPAHITLQGFTIEGCDGTAVAFGNAMECEVVGCTIRNAGSGVSLSTCKDCLVYGNDIYETGSSGVTAYSGNRNPENPDGNRIENNYIHHTGYFSKTSNAVAVTGMITWACRLLGSTYSRCIGRTVVSYCSITDCIVRPLSSVSRRSRRMNRTSGSVSTKTRMSISSRSSGSASTRMPSTMITAAGSTLRVSDDRSWVVKSYTGTSTDRSSRSSRRCSAIKELSSTSGWS